MTSYHGFEDVGIWNPFPPDPSTSLRELRDQLDETKRELKRVFEEKASHVQELEDLRALLVRQVAQSKEATEKANELSQQMEEQQDEVRRLRLENAQLKALASTYQQDKPTSDQEMERLRDELDQASKISSLRNATGRSMKPGFEPPVAIYDIVDDKKGLRRIVRVEAPGRCLDNDGVSTVTGSVHSLENGVRISLSKSADIPSDAVFTSRHVVQDLEGSWNWDYKPKDGVWQLAESWGLAHGIYAVALERKFTGKAKARSTPSPQKPLRMARSLTPMRRNRTSVMHCAGLAMEEGRSLVAVLPPPSSANPLFSYFRKDTVFVAADGSHLDCDEIEEGQELLGPDGIFQVIEIIRDVGKDREVFTLQMETEGVSIVKGTQVSSVVVTSDGAATADIEFYDVSELKARTHELAMRVNSGAEATVPIVSVALSTQRAAVIALRLTSDSGFRAVFVATKRNLHGYIPTKIKHVSQDRSKSPKSSRTPSRKTPFSRRPQLS